MSLAAPEDAAAVLEQFVHDVANTPAEITHLLEEIQAKDLQISAFKDEINKRDAQLQKWVRINGGHVLNPKEEAFSKTINDCYDKCEILQAEKCGLSEKALIVLERQIKRLDIGLRSLSAREEFPSDWGGPSLLSGSVTGISTPVATGASAGPLQAVSGNVGTSGGAPNIANAAQMRMAQTAAGARGGNQTPTANMARGQRESSTVGVATSSSLEVGSWTDHGSIGIPESSEYNRIDPNWFKESSDDPIYFGFGSAWDAIFQTELNISSLTVSSDAGTPENLIYNSTEPVNQSIPAIVEGSFLFWWEVDGQKYYYMFFSSGACCNAADALAAPGDEYKIMVCRSDSATGPFTDEDRNNCLTDNGGTLVLGSHGEVYAPGGQGVYVDPDVDRPVVYYHYVNTSIGYDYDQFQFGFNYLDFSTTWPVVVT